MKITIESTSKITMLVGDGGGAVAARVWEGYTESGIRIHAFITRIAVSTQEDTSEFERDLLETRPPSDDIARQIPSRMVL